MTNKPLTKEERSLLLFFEYTAVDEWGWIKDLRCMNAEDFKIMKSWNESGFVLSKRATKRAPDGGIQHITYVVRLSDEAWEMAHKLRKEKALRHIPEKLRGGFQVNGRLKGFKER